MSSQIDLLNTRIILFLRQLRKSKQLKLLPAPNLPKMQDLIYTSVPAFLSVGKNKTEPLLTQRWDLGVRIPGCMTVLTSPAVSISVLCIYLTQLITLGN